MMRTHSIDGNKNSEHDATTITIKTTMIIRRNNNKPVARGDGDTDMKPQRHKAATSMATQGATLRYSGSKLLLPSEELRQATGPEGQHYHSDGG